MMDEQRFEMRVAVVLTRVMVPVIFAKRRQEFQPLVDVLDQATFIVVDVNTAVMCMAETSTMPSLTLLWRTISSICGVMCT